MSNVPKLRFKEFNGEWEEKKLGSIANFYNSKRIPLTDTDRIKGQYPYYGASGIIDYVQDYIFDGEYILLGEDGANIVMRNSRLVFLAKGKFWVNNHAHVFQAKESNSFLCEALERINYTKYNTGTAQPKLNAEVVKKIKLNLPQKQEQEKIASFLTSVDTKIEQLTKKEELLQQYKKGVMQKIFNQEIRFSPKGTSSQAHGEADVKTVTEDNCLSSVGLEPESMCKAPTEASGSEFCEWEKHELKGFLIERIDYPNNPLPIYSLTIENGIIPKSERYERAFLVKDGYEYKIMKKDDFAFNPMNLRFGALARHKEDLNVMVSKYYNIFYCNEKLNSYFAELYFTNYNSIQYYNKMATGSLEEKKRVHFKEFLKFKFKFPCIEEQNIIANFLSSIDNKIEQTQKQLKQTKEFKKALLQQMFV